MDGHQIAFQRCLKFQNDISVLKLLIRKEKNPSILVFKTFESHLYRAKGGKYSLKIARTIQPF